MGNASTTRVLAAGVGLGGILLLASGCGDDGDIVGSGTGGDHEMPDDPSPGPHGPGCSERLRQPPGLSPSDPTAASQPGAVTRVVELRGDDAALAETTSSVGTSTAAALTTAARPLGATTEPPHIHERWGESRKLELSYCINDMPGDDAELEESYTKTIRSLNSTMAEWERVSGARPRGEHSRDRRLQR